MPRPLPTPVAALVGLVPTVADRVRQLPLKAVRLPIVVLSGALTQADRTKAEYDALAERGAAFVGRLRGTAEDFAEEVSERADDLEDKVEELSQRLPSREAPDPTPLAEQPKGEPTPKAPKETAAKKVDTAASPAAALAAELVAAASAAPDVDHDTLPLPDYDHLTLGSLRGRLRSLTSDELVQIRAYERSHADRLPVVTMLDNRIAKLAADAGSQAAGPGQPG